MTYYTYIPATGGIFMYEETGITLGRPDLHLAGLAAPMIPGVRGNGISASAVSRIVGGRPVPVAETLSEYIASEQIKPGAGEEIDHCHEIMLLPALLELATYPSLHSMFSEVPLARNDSRHLLPDGSTQSGPLDEKGAVRHKAAPALHVEFDAKAHIMDVQEPVNGLYTTLRCPNMAGLQGLLEEREIRHEREAFEALRDIEYNITMNDIDEGREDRTLATKLRNVIRSTRSAYGSRITHVAMGARMYQRYLKSAGIHGSPVPGSSHGTPGVGPMPGLEYVTVAISPLIDAEAAETIYAVDRHGGAFYGQGAIALDTYGVGATRITEYYQYIITDRHVDRAGAGLPERRTALRIDVPG